MQQEILQITDGATDKKNRFQTTNQNKYIYLLLEEVEHDIFLVVTDV